MEDKNFNGEINCWFQITWEGKRKRDDTLRREGNPGWQECVSGKRVSRAAPRSTLHFCWSDFVFGASPIYRETQRRGDHGSGQEIGPTTLYAGNRSRKPERRRKAQQGAKSTSVTPNRGQATALLPGCCLPTWYPLSKRWLPFFSFLSLLLLKDIKVTLLYLQSINCQEHHNKLRIKFLQNINIVKIVTNHEVTLYLQNIKCQDYRNKFFFLLKDIEL